MGFWFGINLKNLRESQSGAVTLEAALGIGALIVTASLLIQVVAVVVLQIQLQTIGYEALRIAVASGDVSKRIWQAESFILSENPLIESAFEPDLSRVSMRLSLPLPVRLPGLPTRLSFVQSAQLLDRAIW